MPHRGCVVALPALTRTPGFYSLVKKRGIIDRHASTDERYLRSPTRYGLLPFHVSRFTFLVSRFTPDSASLPYGFPSRASSTLRF